LTGLALVYGQRLVGQPNELNHGGGLFGALALGTNLAGRDIKIWNCSVSWGVAPGCRVSVMA
jgi:hypothetical protein